MNKKVPCTDFCNCGPTYDNTDSDPILENSNFPDDDNEKVNDDLYKMDLYLGRNYFKVLQYFETHLHLVFVECSLHLGRSTST